MYSDQWYQTFDPHLQEEKVRDARARRLESSRLRIALFKALQVDSYSERQASLEKIIQVVKSYMRTAKTAFSPIKSASLSRSTSGETPRFDKEKTPSTTATTTVATTDISLTTDTTEAPNGVTASTSTVSQTYDDILAPMTCLEIGCPEEELQYFLLTMLRLSYTCPFRDVRLAFQQFLKTTLETGIIPTPQPLQLSPSYFIPLQDIFSLESTSSVQNVISYPRPSNLSFSPWSHDAASDCGASDSIDMNKPSSTHQNPYHSQQHHHRRQQQQQQQQQQHYRHSQSRLTPVASSFSSSTSSLLKPNSFGDPSCYSSSDHGDDVEHNHDSDRDDDDEENGGNISDGDESSLDDGASKSHSFTTRGKCTGGRPSDEYVRQMLVRSFLEEGRLTNVYRIMSFFPTFYEIFQTTIAAITKASIGPLHRTWRTYLGIMASAEQKCQYLVSTLKLDFLQNGGDPAWLKGINHCPAKLQRITGFLTKMARKPWRLTEDDILELMTVSHSTLRTGSTPSLNMTWSKGELVQAILVISTFLGLGSFVLSCAVAPELDMYGGYYVHGGDDPCCGIENELDYDMQQHRQQKPRPRHYQHLSKEDELAVRAASSATGWYDSQISAKSSKCSEDESDDNDDDDNDNAGHRPEQQSFQSDKGAGLGVSLFDSGEDGENALINDGQHNSLYLNRTTALISQLKSSKDVLNDELHQSLANLNLFSSSTHNTKNQVDVTQAHQDKDGLGNLAATDHQNNNDSIEKQQGNAKVNAVYEDLSRFSENIKTAESLLAYEEFEAGHQDYGEFMLSEYCWEDHGCDLVNHFMPGVGDELDDEFIEALSITDWSIFHQVADGTVDTSPLRNAIFFYVQQLLGVTKEDYDYEDITKYLSEQTQRYIQKVCRQPHLLDRYDWNNVGISLRSEEKCHMNLLIASARKQALLCYGLSLVSHV